VTGRGAAATRYHGGMFHWAVAGIGDIATRRVIPAILGEPRSRLYGVVTRDPVKGARYATLVWTDLGAALSDPAVDALYIATPVSLHAPMALAALRAGKHVVCEKPMALDYASACTMAEAAREAGKLLGVAYYRRFYPKLRRAQELVARDAIGRPVLAIAATHNWFNAEDGCRSWLLDPAMAGGGPLYDTACHRIDVFNFLFGQPAAVAAQLSNVVHHGKTEDNATVLIEYDSGVRCIVDARRHSRIPRDEFRIIGANGEMELSPLNSPMLVYPGGTEQLPPHPNFHYPLVENFVSAALGEVPLVSSGETALATEWVIEQAVHAVRQRTGSQTVT
jgi:1,5-anhydro-D-fructose reductase (1,5-anhydro-D-mannitol-forming)